MLRFIRRVHMYSGLLLLPFVLLYGLTGWLFNHPTHFSKLDSHWVDLADVEAAGFSRIAAPKQLANEVTKLLAEQLRAADPRSGQREDDFQILESQAPQFSRRLVGNANANGTEYALRVNLKDKRAEFFDRPPVTDLKIRPAAPFSMDLDVDSSELLLELYGRESEFKLQRLFASQGIDTGQVRVRGQAPELRFAMRYGGEDWLVRYDSRQARVRGHRLGEPLNEVEPRNFLTRLHLQHGYGDSLGARTFWAFLVDVMSVLLLFWGISGLLMWLQLKPFRRSGGLFLTAGLLVAAALGAAMFFYFRG
ncbi:MAG: hypothetical protein CSA62_04460 [Planctomycetota bacterium]|nr:MAG: hypothetical protein CSA62_04460 [Planctomycetota bacterium]